MRSEENRNKTSASLPANLFVVKNKYYVIATEQELKERVKGRKRKGERYVAKETCAQVHATFNKK